MPQGFLTNSGSELSVLLRQFDSTLDSLYRTSSASRWKLSRSQFGLAVYRSVAKRFSEESVSKEKVLGYLETLHTEDLALAAACMEGSEEAWTHFVGTFRGYLRGVAGAMTKGGSSGTDPQELADSLFAELFGLTDGKRGEASLLGYFHGRSSLKTWLRTLLAQRHIDRIRESRRWESIESDGDGEPKSFPEPFRATPSPPLDPHKNRYLKRFLLALSDCLEQLQSRDLERLGLYYARGKTLAEIGRMLGEHESSASRHLERTRRELRAKVEECLRTGCHSASSSRRLPQMSEAEIQLCFQYAAEDAPIDFRKIFPETAAGNPETEGKELP